MIRTLYSVLLISVIALSGCATTKTLNQADKQRLEKIYIAAEHVKHKPTKEIVYLNTDKKAWASFLGGPIGAIIYEAADDHEPEAMIIKHLNSGDLLKKTVADSFRYQFEQAGIFEITEKNKADAYLEIEIGNVQFHEMNGDDLKYTGIYFARLFDIQTDEMLWSQHDFFSAFNGNLVEYTLEEYVSDPAKLRYAASIVSQMLAIEFIKNLGGNPGSVNHSLHSVDSYKIASLDETPEVQSVEILKEELDGSSADLENRMSRLKDLFDKKLITQGEYDLKRQDLLSNL